MKPVEQLSPLGQHIRNYRKANRWSIQALAKKHGISNMHLWQIENGIVNNPTISSLVKLAAATKTSLANIARLAADGLRVDTPVSGAKEK